MEREDSPDPVEPCPICMDQLSGAVVATGCGHIFCFPCLSEWLIIAKACPLCKTACNGIVAARNSQGAAMTPETVRKYGELPQQFLTTGAIIERAEWRQRGRGRDRNRGRGSRGGRARGRWQGGQNRHGGYMDQSPSHSRSPSPPPSADVLVAPSSPSPSSSQSSSSSLPDPESRSPARVNVTPPPPASPELQVYLGLNAFLFQKWGHVVRTFKHSWTTDRAWLTRYARALQEGGFPLHDCVGFADGTHIPVARPSIGQRSWYCGHHGCHCFKCQVILYPCGLCTAFGPFRGSLHDSTAAEEIGLDRKMIEHCSFPGRNFCLYLDSGYGVGQATITPYRRGWGQTRDEAEFNRVMSGARIAVEWQIGHIKTLWSSVTNKENMKALMSPVSVFWFNAVLLTNLHTIFSGGNQISQKFGISPPSAETYLNGD